MVTKWGMSEKLGPLQYEEQQEGYLGYGGAQRLFASDETNKLIDSEIRGLVDDAHQRATGILTAHEEKLHALAMALLEFETLTGDEIKELLETGKIDRPDVPSGPSRPGARARIVDPQGRQAVQPAREPPLRRPDIQATSRQGSSHLRLAASAR